MSPPLWLGHCPSYRANDKVDTLPFSQIILQDNLQVFFKNDSFHKLKNLSNTRNDYLREFLLI